GEDLARARSALPSRCRLVCEPKEKDSPVALVTDEDGPSDDPPILSVAPRWQRVHVGHPTLSSVLVAMAIPRIFADTLHAGSANAKSERPFARPLAPVANQVFERSPGVVQHGGKVYFADSGVFAAYFEGGKPPPPDGVVRLSPKKKPPFLPESLRASD